MFFHQIELYTTEYYSHKKRNLAIYDNMDIPWEPYIMLSEISQEKTNTAYDLFYMWNLNKKPHQAHSYEEYI